MAGADGQQVYDVLDKEIKTYIDLIEASGAYVTIFFDCCHSGSGTRGEQKVLTRKTPEDSRTRTLDTLEPRTATRLADMGNDIVVSVKCRTHQDNPPTVSIGD